MRDALIFDGLRTPFGRHAGALAPVRPDDLLGGVIAESDRAQSLGPRGDRGRGRRLRESGG